ncbi:hypothetical protein BJ878DRAFT_495561 [Calycina marina]|uniref:Apple domain-containing protein n=1 Tax=Calycina marina TaxID=1763456 RepID=A0A9P7Z7R7_9HELO|nr:hypothetical protein BJ878DRAFT_495561 [Calycina marina]
MFSSTITTFCIALGLFSVTIAAPISITPTPSHPTHIVLPQATSLGSCFASCQDNTACSSYIFESGICNIFTSTPGRFDQEPKTEASINALQAAISALAPKLATFGQSSSQQPFSAAAAKVSSQIYATFKNI